MMMLDNGNYESVVCPIQHKCTCPENPWITCIQHASDMNNMILTITDGDPYEVNGCEHVIEVSYCPFCGKKATEC